MEATNPVSAFLRREVDRVARAWETRVLERLPALGELQRAALLDHMPEFICGLASWVDGDEPAGRRGFEALAYGHAMSRLGHGIDLESLSIEHQIMRSVILEQLLELDSSREVRAALIRLNEGIDLAINDSIHHYTKTRESVRERFVGILGHDLRNPIHAVSLAAASMVATPCSESKHARMAAMIVRSSERMMRMIADVIDFAHAQLGEGIPTVPKLCDMADLCDEAVAELRVVHPHRQLRVTRAGDTSGNWDRDRLLQVASNLVANAIEHGEDPITISVRESEDRMSIHLRVENGGTPIAPERIKTLFDPFASGGEDTRRVREHLGLGLYIVRQIALAHGATVDITSDERSTAFEIHWPRTPRDRLDAKDRQ